MRPSEITRMAILLAGALAASVGCKPSPTASPEAATAAAAGRECAAAAPGGRAADAAPPFPRGPNQWSRRWNPSAAKVRDELEDRKRHAATVDLLEHEATPAPPLKPAHMMLPRTARAPGHARKGPRLPARLTTVAVARLIDGASTSIRARARSTSPA
jgi:hypothetical protein